MEQLWAPWRMEYIKRSPDDGCVLCEVAVAGDDAANHILFRGSHTYVVMNLYPYCNGHLMIAPFAHVADYTDLDEQTLLECSLVTQKALKGCRRAARARPLRRPIGVPLERLDGIFWRRAADS